MFHQVLFCNEPPAESPTDFAWAASTLEQRGIRALLSGCCPQGVRAASCPPALNAASRERERPAVQYCPVLTQHTEHFPRISDAVTCHTSHGQDTSRARKLLADVAAASGEAPLEATCSLPCLPLADATPGLQLPCSWLQVHSLPLEKGKPGPQTAVSAPPAPEVPGLQF